MNASFLSNLSLKNKILFSSLAVILLVSLCIALMARYILITSLTKELELRGLGIANSIADRSKSLIITQDHPNLVSLVFEADEVGERRNLISYIFILDQKQRVLASTFIRPFPEDLRSANIIPQDDNHSVKLLRVADESAYDVAVSIKEGIYDIGSVHVGLSKQHIDSIISKLRMAFIGFLSIIVLIMFYISHKLAYHITRPIAQLIGMADAISRNNLDFDLEFGPRPGCWEIQDCSREECPAHGNNEAPCWSLEGTLCDNCPPGDPIQKLENCRECEVYRQRAGDEVVQLADAFQNMVRHIREYRDQIKKSQQKYRSLFHSGPDPIFVLSCSTQHILDANPMAAEIYGFTRKELVGMNFRELGPELCDACIQTFRPNEPDSMAGCVFYPKMLSYKKDNKPFYANVHACGAIYEDEPAIIVSANDITDMIEKDAQLIQASKMKTLGEMSAGMAHELNQPLNAIKIGSEYLSLLVEKNQQQTGNSSAEECSLPMDRVQKTATEISAQVDRAADIINTLRAFGRKADLSKERLDLNKPVTNVMRILGQQLKLDNINIDLQLAENLPPILAHSNRLEQVFFNMVTNARDAVCSAAEASNGDHPRSISIRTSTQDGAVTVTVEDTGEGIAEGDLKKIFEPFYTTKEIGKGMGLGLAISYGIIKDYKGDIQVNSAPGKGTVFAVSFPAV